MRLIDGEELKTALDGYLHHITLIKKRSRKTEEAILADVKGIIDSAPTIEERKKGKWLRDPPEGGYALYKCSVCGKCWLHWWASTMTVEQMTKEVRCCPNCGADMRG